MVNKCTDSLLKKQDYLLHNLVFFTYNEILKTKYINYFPKIKQFLNTRHNNTIKKLNISPNLKSALHTAYFLSLQI